MEAAALPLSWLAGKPVGLPVVLRVPVVPVEAARTDLVWLAVQVTELESEVASARALVLAGMALIVVPLPALELMVAPWMVSLGTKLKVLVLGCLSLRVRHLVSHVLVRVLKLLDVLELSHTKRKTLQVLLLQAHSVVDCTQISRDLHLF